MPDKYGAEQDPYCYPNSDVLVNLLNIRDSAELEQAEAAFTARRYRSYSSSKLTVQQFTLAHLQKLHYHLFQDIYSWAGKLRTVDISKGATRFCHCPRIEPEAQKLLSELPRLHAHHTQTTLAADLAYFYSELNMIHPFREGNGRAQRFFFEELLFMLGYELHWPVLDSTAWVQVNIAAVNFDIAPLTEIFKQALSD